MEKMNPLISIIVPNYNHERFLKQRLESIFNQTYTNFEVILLDDCSTDNSREILLEYIKNPKVSNCFFNETNSGSPFKQWNKGIALAKGEYIWIAESDDYCELNFIEKIMDVLVKNTSIGLCYCQTVDIDENGRQLFERINYTKQFQPNIWGDVFLKEGRDFVISYLSFFNVIPNASAVIFKKELIETTIFSDSLLRMKMCGDWYFWTKIILIAKVFFLPETLNYFREHGAVSRNHKNIEKKKLRLIEEKEIRSFMQSYKINNLKSEQLLYQKWFQLHSVKAILFKSFYSVKLEKTAIYSFIWDYICYKWRGYNDRIRSKYC